MPHWLWDELISDTETVIGDFKNGDAFYVIENIG